MRSQFEEARVFGAGAIAIALAIGFGVSNPALIALCGLAAMTAMILTPRMLEATPYRSLTFIRRQRRHSDFVSGSCSEEGPDVPVSYAVL